MQNFANLCLSQLLDSLKPLLSIRVCLDFEDAASLDMKSPLANGCIPRLESLSHGKCIRWAEPKSHAGEEHECEGAQRVIDAIRRTDTKNVSPKK